MYFSMYYRGYSQAVRQPPAERPLGGSNPSIRFSIFVVFYMEELQLGIYKHFKGLICEVIALAKDSETKELMVVYKELQNKSIWVRPLKMFTEHVERDDYSGPRFVYVGKN